MTFLLRNVSKVAKFLNELLKRLINYLYYFKLNIYTPKIQNFKRKKIQAMLPIFIETNM